MDTHSHELLMCLSACRYRNARDYCARRLPTNWQARLIEVKVGRRLRRFITSLLDHHAHLAQQLADLYRQRWEIELGFREIK